AFAPPAAPGDPPAVSGDTLQSLLRGDDAPWLLRRARPPPPAPPRLESDGTSERDIQCPREARNPTQPSPRAPSSARRYGHRYGQRFIAGHAAVPWILRPGVLDRHLASSVGRLSGQRRLDPA